MDIFCLALLENIVGFATNLVYVRQGITLIWENSEVLKSQRALCTPVSTRAHTHTQKKRGKNKRKCGRGSIIHTHTHTHTQKTNKHLPLNITSSLFLLGWVSLQSSDLLSLFHFLFFLFLISSCVKLSKFRLFGQISLFPR